jgi:hypothetical protein
VVTFVGALFLLAFIGCELSIREPLDNLELFSHLRYAAAAVVALIFGAGIYGSSYLVPLFVQTVQGYTPTRAGELLIPGGPILGLVFPSAGWLTDRLPHYLLVATGLFIFGLSNVLLFDVTADTGFWRIALLVTLGRIGLGVMMPLLNAGALSVLPSGMLAQGTGTINFVRQLGGAFGVPRSRCASPFMQTRSRRTRPLATRRRWSSSTASAAWRATGEYPLSRCWRAPSTTLPGRLRRRRSLWRMGTASRSWESSSGRGSCRRCGCGQDTDANGHASAGTPDPCSSPSMLSAPRARASGPR